MPSSCSSPGLSAILPTNSLTTISHLKHPDPMLAPKLVLKDPKLQLRGSWQKLDISIPSGSRLGVASFVYGGSAYVFGGEKDLDGPYFRELWRLDLTKLDKWRAMAPYPIPESVTGKLVGYNMCVSGDGKAYLFTGRSQVDYFDLKTGRWGAIGTKYKAGKGEARWPYPQNRLSNYAMQCVGEKLYVFGGHHVESNVGCNLFLELDLKTREWRRLSGSVIPKKADYDGPGPRNYACMWAGKDKQRIYVMFGDADRQSAMLNSQMHGSRNAYGYDDVWAWDIEKGCWEREKLLGNVPSPRSEMACEYVWFFFACSPRTLNSFPIYYFRIRSSTWLSYSAGTAPPSQRHTRTPSKRRDTRTTLTPSYPPPHGRPPRLQVLHNGSRSSRAGSRPTVRRRSFFPTRSRGRPSSSVVTLTPSSSQSRWENARRAVTVTCGS
jgi:hypothetical protein